MFKIGQRVYHFQSPENLGTVVAYGENDNVVEVDWDEFPTRWQNVSVLRPTHKFNVGDTIRNSHLKTAIDNTGRITEQTNEGYMVLWSDCVEPWSQSFTYIEGEYELVEEDWAMNPKAPAHYVEGRTIEPRSVIKDWELNFNLGNALKYVARCGRKGDAVEDLRKAITFLEFEIEDREGNG